ncbi:hypothetical protein L7F22_062294, partial [Adiantum nelumboides]|nr:hypothetical protein [Adiantum nelumboides]
KKEPSAIFEAPSEIFSKWVLLEACAACTRASPREWSLGPLLNRAPKKHLYEWVLKANLMKIEVLSGLADQ